jgi:hypothetical protein
MEKQRTPANLCKINKSLPPGIELVQADDFEQWLLDIKVLDDNPLYKDQTFRLKFKFSNSYPIGAFSNLPSKLLPSPFPATHFSPELAATFLLPTPLPLLLQPTQHLTNLPHRTT